MLSVESMPAKLELEEVHIEAGKVGGGVFQMMTRNVKWTRTMNHSDQVHTGSPSHGGNVAIYVFDVKQPSLPTPFYSFLLCVSVFMALSAVFHSINSPNNSTFSLFYRSYFCLIGLFSHKSLYESLPQPRYNPLWLTGLKAPTNQPCWSLMMRAMFQVPVILFQYLLPPVWIITTM